MCIDEIIDNHQCGFQHKTSTADHILCIRHMLDKRWEYSETVRQVFIQTSRKLMIQLGVK
jgi:hypothetical protein